MQFRGQTELPSSLEFCGRLLKVSAPSDHKTLVVLCHLVVLAAYSSTKQALRKGDRLLLYTDGVIEAANGGEEEFGQERLGRLLTASVDRTAEEMADLILSTVQEWASTQMDDLTVVVCDCH